MAMIAETYEMEVSCPYCGETFTTLIDTSESEQSYIEDCFVCCRPIQFDIRCEDGAVISVNLTRS
jgi:hypothetical protein